MKRVLILSHGFIHDKRNNVTFHECIVANPDPDAKPGSKVRLGVAEDVDPAIVREFFLGHRNYQVFGYTDEELYPDGVPDAVMEAREALEPDEEPKGEAEDDTDTSEDSEEEESEGNPLAGLDFNNDNAAEMAAIMGLAATDFDGITATGKGGGYLTSDVRLANKKRQA